MEKFVVSLVDLDFFLLLGKVKVTDVSNIDGEAYAK